MISWKSGLVLLLVLAALVVYALQTRTGSQPSRPVRGLLPCAPGETVDLRVTGADGRVVEAHRLSPAISWRLTLPSPGPADSAAVDDLLATAAELHPTDSASAPPAGQDLGLDPPRATLACTLRSGASYTLSIGGRNFDSTGVYARAGADPKLHVIPASTAEKFQKVLAAPPYRPSPNPSGSPSPSPSA